MRVQPAAKAFALALALAAPGTIAPLFTTAARAADATQAQATTIETALEHYFDNVPGVVSVTPEGDHYKLRVNPAPLASRLPPDIKLSVSPLVYTLTDQGGGMWGTKLAEQPLEVTLDVKDVVSSRASIAALSSIGTFDANKGIFKSSTGQAKGISYSTTNYEKGKVASKSTHTIESAEAKTQTAPGTDGIDVTSDVTLTGINQTMSFPTPPMMEAPSPTPEGAEPKMTEIAISAASGAQSGKATGVRWQGILGLYRWFLKHNSKEAIEANKAELSGLISTALPIFGNISGNGSLNTVSMTTPMGVFGADKMNFNVDMNGVVADGKVREAVTLQGLKVPDGMLPSWADPLMPQKVTLDLNVSNFDLAATAKVMLDALATGQDLKGPEADEKLLKAILPTGRVTLGTQTTELSGKDYSLTAEGSAQVGPAPAQPDLDFTLTMKGFDNVLKALDGLPPPMKQRAVPMLMLARGFAQTGPSGDLTWKITSSEDGHLLINGQDMGPLKK